MATERQITANRRNGTKSTGPRSIGGKKRASRNAHRHGLSSVLSSKGFIETVERLAREIADPTTDQATFEHARAAAEAELELARVRRARLALIERASALGSLKTPRHFERGMDEARWLIARYKWAFCGGKKPSKPKPLNPPAPMPTSEPERSSEALRRVLPELIKLSRYERRAAGRRDRAVRKLSARRIKVE